MPKPTPLPLDVVAERLEDELPAWSLKNGHLNRVYTTGGWRASMMIAGAIGHLAELAWHHPELVVAYPSVTVRLMTHDAGGITDLDFALAAKIEALVTWAPRDDANSPLPGLPTDTAHDYVT
jgi:pterin-4a-carbinolamine dehydratase